MTGRGVTKTCLRGVWLDAAPAFGQPLAMIVRFLPALGGIALSASLWCIGPVQAQSLADQPMVEVVMPDLSGDAVIGARVFAARCAECHGANGTGNQAKGPPLIHKIYEPSHHADYAFELAVAQGVIQHHWSFGNMPAVDGVTGAEVRAVIAFVRQVQQANGIR